MEHELIARYIYAVTRHLPPKTRDDVQKELDSLISDMLSERCGAITPTEKDVRVVLTELGTPEELAAKYSGEEQRSLIGGVYYLIYMRLLKIVLPIVAGAVALSILVSRLVSISFNSPSNPYIQFGLTFGYTLGGAIGAVFQAFAVITFIFAILERSKAKITGTDYLSYLPPVPKQIERIKPYEPIIGIFWSVAVAIFLLGFPVAFGFWTSETGWIPILNEGVIRGLWAFVILWSVLGIADEAVKLVEGRYSKRVLITTFCTNVLTIASMAFVFLNNNIINPDVTAYASERFGDGKEIILWGITNFPLFFLGIASFAMILETAALFVKVRKYDNDL